MSKRHLFIALFLSALLLSGCSLPKIIVLHDPLSADEHVRLGGVYDAPGQTRVRPGHHQADGTTPPPVPTTSTPPVSFYSSSERKKKPSHPSRHQWTPSPRTSRAS